MTIFDRNFSNRIRFYKDTTKWALYPQVGRTWYGIWIWFLCFHCHITTQEYKIVKKDDK